MNKEEFFKSKLFRKVLLPLLIVFSIIAIFQNGYHFGQWLAKIFP